MKFRRLTSAFLAVVMVGVNIFNGLLPVVAAADDPTVRNPEPIELDDGVILSKTAKSVDGWANMWDVTLRIEVPVVTVTSDTILVLDRSGSMSGNRMTLAKSAAKSLARQLLPEGNTVNRIAVISFGSDVIEEIGFSDDYETVADAIDDVVVGGGTFTQGGLHSAAELIATSTATHKNVILLSDGLPSYSYAINNVGNHLAAGGPNFHSNQFETEIINSASDFDYTRRVGDGGTSMPDNYEVWYQYWHQGDQYRYYNHGNSAISEANFFKESDNGDLWTIAFNAGATGSSVLGQMASPGKNKTASESDLHAIFDEIAGAISSLITSSSVHDVMGEGVVVENPQHSTSLDWTPTYTYDETIGKYVASYTYEVEAGEHILDEDSTDGFHPLNEEATISYNGKTEKFPVPYVKPFYVNITKNVEGQSCGVGECVFDFEIAYPNGKTKTGSVEAGNANTHRILEPFPIGDYTLTETGTSSNNPVELENYLVSYVGNNFTINEQHSDHVDVTINNNYETKTITAEKEWSDDNNRDGLRAEYDNLYLAIKDGDKYVAFEKVGVSDTQSFTFSNLPKYRNGLEIAYTLVEAVDCSDTDGEITCISDFVKDENYASVVSGNKVTNSHTPKTTTLNIKKKWDITAGTLPSVTPEFVTVEVSNDKNNNVQSIILRGNSYEEWEGTFEGYKYENGQEINYEVVEKTIGNNAFESGKSTLYIYNDTVLEGKWAANYNGSEVTNVWTPAETVYTGSGEFYIEKLDQDGRPLQGVTFTIGNNTYTTGADGKAAVEFSGEGEAPEEDYSFSVEETSAPDYYALIDGTANIGATTKLNLTVNEEALTNTYTKNFEYTAGDMASGYVWRADDNTLVATDQALAKELRIEKTFSGISAEAFEENSNINFTVVGPEGFDEVTVGIDDERCEVSGSKLVCELSGTDTVLPIGQYTVTENDADINNFTYESTPRDGKVSQTVGLGEVATFELENVYTSVNTATYKVKKEWIDDNNRDGIRPQELEITIYADGEAYGSSVTLDEDGEWVYEWKNLPLVNEDAKEIEYTVEEADIDGYDSDGGIMEGDVFVFTNTHEPELYDRTGELQVEKIWSGENNELARPATITLELYGETSDDEGNTRTWLVDGPVEVSSINDWKWTFENLYKYEDGKEILYSVQESAIGETSFAENESTIIVYENDSEVLKGKWDRTVANFEITNTWTPAINVYNGNDSFTIKKIDQDGEPMKGIAFEINNDEQVSDDDGLIPVEVAEATDVAEDDLVYEIREIETQEGYDLVEGSATVKVKSASQFISADIETLTNTYIKTYTYDVVDDDGYSWDNNAKILTVINERSMAKSLTIRKTFSGVSELALQNVTFTVTGPEDFGEDGEITLSFSDDCAVSRGQAICTVDADIPTGTYMVKEDGAEIENFTLTVSGDNETEKEIEKDDEAIFEIDNTYDVDRISYIVVKFWDDMHDKDGVRPETLSVDLLADGEAVETGELSTEYIVSSDDLPEELADLDAWWYEFVDLPVANEDAEVITYMAEENIESNEYEQAEAIYDDYASVFINYHEPKPEDPCANGGCGGPVIPITPNTGKFTKAENSNGNTQNEIIGGIAIVAMGIISITVLGMAQVAKCKQQR